MSELIDYEQFCGLTLEPNSGAAASDDLAPPELAALLARSATDAAPLLLDVREPWEHELVALPGSVLVPLGLLPAAIDSLPRDRAIVAYCHHGIRSRHALDLLHAAGFTAHHLTGGIDAWSTQVDPTVERY